MQQNIKRKSQGSLGRGLFQYQTMCQNKRYVHQTRKTFMKNGLFKIFQHKPIYQIRMNTRQVHIQNGLELNCFSIQNIYWCFNSSALLHKCTSPCVGDYTLTTKLRNSEKDIFGFKIQLARFRRKAKFTAPYIAPGQHQILEVKIRAWW